MATETVALLSVVCCLIYVIRLHYQKLKIYDYESDGCLLFYIIRLHYQKLKIYDCVSVGIFDISMVLLKDPDGI